LKETQQANESFLVIVEKDSFDKIDDIKGSCAPLRKTIASIRVRISRIAFAIITNSIFEAISLFVIIANSIVLAVDDPTADSQSALFQKIDNVFLILYTIEMVLKVLGLGFVMKKGAYLRDYWNILDFIIVSAGYVALLL